MINNLQSIVHEIDTKVNADSSSSKPHHASQKSLRNELKAQSKPSLVERMSNRLQKYAKAAKNYTTDNNFTTKSSQKSGNNPLFAYPSIPPPVMFDPKYSADNKEKYTKFVTKTYSNGQEMNPLDTVGEFTLFIHSKFYF